MQFNWRDHLDEVSDVLDYWNRIATSNNGWPLPEGTLWIEGAIYGLTKKKVAVSCMVDICKALGVPYREREDGMVEWGDAISVVDQPLVSGHFGASPLIYGHFGASSVRACNSEDKDSKISDEFAFLAGIIGGGL